MSVQSELTRITNAKSSIKMAIENKGVAVPSVTKLDGMAALINNITAGELPYTSYTIDDFEAEENASRNGSVITISGTTENSIFLNVDSTKTYNIGYNSVNCGLIGLSDDGTWTELFNYATEGYNIKTVTGAGSWYFYPLDNTQSTFELHNLNILEATPSGPSANVITGSYTVTKAAYSITLTACIGKSNIVLFPYYNRNRSGYIQSATYFEGDANATVYTWYTGTTTTGTWNSETGMLSSYTSNGFYNGHKFGYVAW